MRNFIRFLIVNLFLLNAYSVSAAVLYDQTGQTPTGNGAPDQNFEATFDSNDSAVADDFVVTDSAGWVIDRLNIIGSLQFLDAIIDSVDIAFYPDNAGSPDEANPVSGCSFTALPITERDDGNFSTDLPGGCTLPSGTFWFSHITNMDQGGGANGQHFASNTNTVTGNEAHWKNPGDGFGTGCTTFQPASTCGLVGGGPPTYDFLFSLEGTQQCSDLTNPQCLIETIKIKNETRFCDAYTYNPATGGYIFTTLFGLTQNIQPDDYLTDLIESRCRAPFD